MEYRKYCVVSGALFSLVALAHLVRIATGMAAQVGNYAVPMGLSWIGLVLAGALAIWAFRIAMPKNAS